MKRIRTGGTGIAERRGQYDILRFLCFLLFKMNTDASYLCGACGEEIVIPIDISQGERQEYVEDCPVCCRANVIVVEIDEDGEARAWAELE
jgi:hypothetical protein